MPKLQPDSLSRLLIDPASVAANASGQLTPVQRATLGRWLRTRWLLGLAGLLVLPLLMLLCIGDLLSAAAPPPPDSPGAQFLTSFPPALAGFWLLVLTPLLIWDLFVLFQLLRLLLNPRRSQIRASDGVLLWEQRYLARIPGQRDLRRIIGGRRIENLAPGTYRFYSLPSLSWLLSALLLGAPSHFSLQEALLHANGFPLNALAFNQTGKLTPEQAHAARSAARWESSAEVILGVIILGSSLALGGIEWQRGQASSQLLVGVLIGCGCGIFFLALAFWPGGAPARSARGPRPQ